MLFDAPQGRRSKNSPNIETTCDPGGGDSVWQGLLWPWDDLPSSGRNRLSTMHPNDLNIGVLESLSTSIAMSNSGGMKHETVLHTLSPLRISRRGTRRRARVSAALSPVPATVSPRGRPAAGSDVGYRARGTHDPRANNASHPPAPTAAIAQVSVRFREQKGVRRVIKIRHWSERSKVFGPGLREDPRTTWRKTSRLR